MKKKYVIVSGGAGYIGSHACKSLSQSGYVPVTVDNLITGWQDSVKFGPFEKIDLLDKNQIDNIFKKYSPIAVMHFAALSQVGESIQKPGLYWKNNVLGSLNLIQSSVDNGCKNFVFSSTCATYGNQDNVILDENSEQYPINPYGASKRAVENILADFELTYDLKYVIFRYFNVAGADPESEVGEFHQPETHLIPLILEAVNKKDSLTIYGTDYDTPDGTCIRDYVHVCDLIDAHVLGLEWLQNKKESSIYNLGSGKGFSVFEVIKNVELVTNKKVIIKEGKRRPGDCAKLVSGSLKAINELGWKPKRSNLRSMISDAWNWHLKGFYNK
jgi:UDP-glucose 4-epimerase